MADSKITALTALTAADPANDMIPIVDVSDTPPASGNTKRISINNLLACSPSATLASATISGDLTVDTSTLKVDSANNYVGVGTTTFVSDANVPFQITTSGGTNSKYIGINRNNAYGVIVGWDGSYDGGEMRVVGAYPLKFGTSNTQRYEISSTGIATWSNVGGVAGTAMTLNSTGLGVGVASPAFKLSAAGVSQFYAESDGIYASGNLSPDLYTIGVNYYNAGGTEGVKVAARPSWKIEHKNSSDALAYLDIGFRAASAAASAFTSRFKIDGTGNVGIGVSPVSKLTVSGGVSLTSAASNHFLRDGTAWIWSSDGASTGTARGGLYADGSSNLNLYGGSTLASHLQINSSGDVISKVNTSVPTVANSQMVFNLTTNTNLRITVRGTDGTLRSANITLAP
jgi:hypothetical protein